MIRAPKSIKYFEWLMYVSFVVDIVIRIFLFDSVRFSFDMVGVLAVPVIWILIKLFCVYKVVYHRAEWARTFLLVLVSLNVFSIFGLFLSLFSNPILFVTILPIILEIMAVYFLFKTLSNVWLKSNTQVLKQDVSTIAENTKWTKIIPWLNIGFMIISVLLVFVLDLMILIDSLELASFFYSKLIVLTIFVAFVFYENKILKRKFGNSDSQLDSWFVLLVILRNFVFVLNFIPVIQLLGGVALMFGSVPYIIIYFLMLRERKKTITVV